MSVFSAFTGVMLPRMSSLLSEGKKEEFKNVTSKSIDFLLIFCFPIIIIAEVFAPQIVTIIAGHGYEGAILPLQIVMPLMLIIGYEQIIIIQMLMPLEKDNAILTNSILGASIAIILNFLIVPRFAAVGTAIVWIACEIAVGLSAQFFVTKYTGYKFPFKKIFRYILAYLPALAGCVFILEQIQYGYMSFVVGILFIGCYFFGIEYYVLKNQIWIELVGSVIKRAKQSMNCNS